VVDSEKALLSVPSVLIEKQLSKVLRSDWMRAR
jgi:hypothetical protein